MRQFSYNFDDISTIQEYESGYPITTRFSNNSMVKAIDMNKPDMDVSIHFMNNTVVNNNIENYTIVARESKGSIMTDGSLAFVLYYNQVPTRNNQTLIPILYGRIDKATGIYCKYLNRKVTVEYDNDHEKKPRVITIS